MGEFLHLRRHVRTGSWENVAMFQSQLFTHQRKKRLVESLVFKFQRQWRPFALAQIFGMVFPAHTQGALEQFALHGIGLVDFIFYANIHLLPEAGNGTHACRMHLAHRLLDFFGIGINDDFRAFGKTKEQPSAFKNVRDWKEIHHTVVLSNWHALVVCLESGMILAVSEHDTFRLSCCSTCIEDVCQIVPIGLTPKHLHLALSREVGSQLQELIEIDGARIAFCQANRAVEDNYLFKRRA